MRKENNIHVEGSKRSKVVTSREEMHIYHLLPCGSTPGTTSRISREGRGNGLVLVFVFSSRGRGVV